MPLHPQAAAFLERRRQDGVRPDHELNIADLRTRSDVPAQAGGVEPVHRVEKLQVEARDRRIPVHVFTPGDSVGIVIYLHGGGHVMGTVDSYQGLLRRLANRVPVTVVAVEYRRAPEHRCPAAVDDAEDVYDWVIDHVVELAPGTAGRVVVAGDSAGGNNAAVLSRRLRDRGARLPALQV